jgi:hypothetical protein
MRVIGSARNYLVTLVGLLALAGAGCGGSGGGGHPPRGGSSYGAYVSLQWGVYDVGDTAYASPLDCAVVGAGQIVVTTDETWQDTFSCLSGGGTTAALPTGNHTLRVTLYGDPTTYGNNSTVLDEISSSVFLGAGTNPQPVVDFLVNSYVLDWTITSGGLATSCASVGAAYVALDIFYTGAPQPTTYYLNCNEGRAATTAIAMGSYSIDWQATLVDTSYHDVSQPTLRSGYTVTNGVQADLGSVYFPF